MIAYIRGTLDEKDPTRVVVEACGVGYEILIPLSTFDRLPKVGEEVKLLAFHSVREDDEVLYGFATKSEREMFAKLTAVSGVGPKIALSILSGGSVGELALAIASGNAKRISSIKGVGKKTAEKICVELKDKVNAIEALSATQRAGRGGADAAAPVLRDAILALSALGFSEETANKMVSGVIAANPDAKDTETVVRLALSGGKK
ncbi:MAG: Holliday junction branch migration protein RuvA [Kiritimatiellae bacterium]|nr:Holliday junction branch migration protein RuvA [Kiritimatiellia bacterium]